MFAAGLCQIASGGDAKLGGKRLQKHGDKTAEKDNAQQRVTEFGSAAKVGRPVARIHIADGDKISGAGESKHFSPERSAGEDGDGAVRFGKRRPPGGMR